MECKTKYRDDGVPLRGDFAGKEADMGHQADSLHLGMGQSVSEKATSDMPLAGRWRRLGTALIDSIGSTVATGVLAFVAALAFGGMIDWLQTTVGSYLFGLLVYVFYYLFFEGLWARTPGKMLLGTKVIDVAGGRPAFGQIVGRTLCRFIPFEPISFLADPVVGWHDSIPKTRVVLTRQT